ncbi:hypothetical protein N2152v2_004624 [Parachlorella kessleri]
MQLGILQQTHRSFQANLIATKDRKSVNAYKRLEASILRGQDLPAADGGPADFQDVARMLYALSLVDPVTAELESPGLAAAAVCLMPSIISAAQEPASVSSQKAGIGSHGSESSSMALQLGLLGGQS